MQSALASTISSCLVNWAVRETLQFHNRELRSLDYCTESKSSLRVAAYGTFIGRHSGWISSTLTSTTKAPKESQKLLSHVISCTGNIQVEWKLFSWSLVGWARHLFPFCAYLSLRTTGKETIHSRLFVGDEGIE
jgi:hypothetical protein